jgi:hypothetical protein
LAKNIKIQTSTDLQPPGKVQVDIEEIKRQLYPMVADLEFRAKPQKPLAELATIRGLPDFVIFAPENTTLRSPPIEGAILPLGQRAKECFDYCKPSPTKNTRTV